MKGLVGRFKSVFTNYWVRVWSEFSGCRRVRFTMETDMTMVGRGVFVERRFGSCLNRIGIC